MTRISLRRRIDRLQDHLLQPGSLEWRLERLTDDLRAAYQTWRARADKAYSSAESRGANLYEEFLADPLAVPMMPKALTYALFPEQRVVDREIAVSNEHAAAGRMDAANQAMVRACQLMLMATPDD